MEDNPNNQTDIQRDNHAYFMIPYEREKEKDYKIYLSKEYEGYETLEEIEKMNVDESKFDLIVKIYRFKIISENKKEVTVSVIVEEEKNTKHEFKINIKCNGRDYYEYNFKIEKIDILPLKYEKQFEIYIDILRKKYKIKQQSKENDDLILASQSLLLGDKKFDFLFYLLIFLECYTTKLVKNHLIIFKPNKIKGIGEISPKKLKLLTNILNSIYKSPDKINPDEKNNRQKIIDSFYSLYLFLIYNSIKKKL